MLRSVLSSTACHHGTASDQCEGGIKYLLTALQQGLKVL